MEVLQKTIQEFNYRMKETAQFCSDLSSSVWRGLRADHHIEMKLKSINAYVPY